MFVIAWKHAGFFRYVEMGELDLFKTTLNLDFLYEMNGGVSDNHLPNRIQAINVPTVRFVIFASCYLRALTAYVYLYLVQLRMHELSALNQKGDTLEISYFTCKLFFCGVS